MFDTIFVIFLCSSCKEATSLLGRLPQAASGYRGSHHDAQWRRHILWFLWGATSIVNYGVWCCAGNNAAWTSLTTQPTALISCTLICSDSTWQLHCPLSSCFLGFKIGVSMSCNLGIQYWHATLACIIGKLVGLEAPIIRQMAMTFFLFLRSIESSL